jgi:hypothetical protein
MDTITLIGVSGAASILLAFLMNQTGRWSSESFKYDAVNALGAGLLVLYSYLIASYPFLVLNLVWFGSAAYDLMNGKE